MILRSAFGEKVGCSLFCAGFCTGFCSRIRDKYLANKRAPFRLESIELFSFEQKESENARYDEISADYGKSLGYCGGKGGYAKPGACGGVGGHEHVRDYPRTVAKDEPRLDACQP